MYILYTIYTVYSIYSIYILCSICIIYSSYTIQLKRIFAFYLLTKEQRFELTSINIDVCFWLFAIGPCSLVDSIKINSSLQNIYPNDESIVFVKDVDLKVIILNYK